MRAFVVTLLVMIVGLFVGLALLDLVKLLVSFASPRIASA